MSQLITAGGSMGLMDMFSQDLFHVLKSEIGNPSVITANFLSCLQVVPG